MPQDLLYAGIYLGLTVFGVRWANTAVGLSWYALWTASLFACGMGMVHLGIFLGLVVLPVSFVEMVLVGIVSICFLLAVKFWK